MNRQKYKFIIYIILYMTISFAQENRLFWDGREWNNIRKTSNYDDLLEYKLKSIYINGVLDGRLYGYLKTWSKNAIIANETFGESVDYLSVREVIKSLNHFYEDPLNSYIPIPSAIIIANLYGQRVPINVIEKYIDFSDLIMNDYNYKDKLMKYFQQNNKEVLKYKEIMAEGPANNKTYTVCVVRKDESILAYGKGPTKKKAEQCASQNALQKLGLLE